MIANRHHSETQNRKIRVRSANCYREVDYASAEAAHQGNSWWGCTVGFRAMQLTADYMADSDYWDIDNLYIVSGHPGPGVLDTIDWVTDCRRKNRLALLEPAQQGCSRDMRYDWWSSNGRQTVHLHLVDGFVPETFYRMVDQNLSGAQSPSEQFKFDQSKRELCDRLWRTPLASAFEVRLLPPLAPGEMPDA